MIRVAELKINGVVAGPHMLGEFHCPHCEQPVYLLRRPALFPEVTRDVREALLEARFYWQGDAACYSRDCPGRRYAREQVAALDALLDEGDGGSVSWKSTWETYEKREFGVDNFIAVYSEDGLVNLWHCVRDSKGQERWHLFLAVPVKMATVEMLRERASAHLKSCYIVVESSD